MAIQNSTLATESVTRTSIFCPLSHSLEAVETVAFTGAPPLYISVLARITNRKTRKHSVSKIARHSFSFFMIREFTVSKAHGAHTSAHYFWNPKYGCELHPTTNLRVRNRAALRAAHADHPILTVILPRAIPWRNLPGRDAIGRAAMLVRDVYSNKRPR